MNIGARFTSCAATLLVLAACASSSSSGNRHARSEPAPAPDAADATYDWHGLVLAPFGTLLKDSQIPVHEVLLFHDEAHGSTDADKDCYAIDGTPPRFVGRQPDQYLLCFDHDRLNRIDVSVQLPADEAPQTFARACARWLGGAAPPAEFGTTCEGRDGGIAFSARLGLEPDETTARVSMTLAAVAAHETVHDAVLDAPHEN